MKLSVRAATMVVVGILLMAMVAPSATAVTPGRWAHGVRCHSRVHFDQGIRWDHEGRWIVTLALANNRNHRSTVHGSWHIDTPRSERGDTVHRHADLASGARQTFEVSYHGQLQDPPTVDLRNCR